MSASVCAVCGSSDFGDPHDGLFFCLECGTQSQDVREEVSQLEDGGGRFTRTLKAKKEKSKKKEGEETDQALPLETFQKVIKRQCDAMVVLGFHPSLKEAAQLIWFTYLRHYGYAFREPGRSVSGRPQSKLQFTSSSSSQLTRSFSGSQSECGTTGEATADGKRGKRGRKRPAVIDDTESSSTVKKSKTTAKKEETAGYDNFPDDKFLFEETETVDKNKGNTGRSGLTRGASDCMDATESVRMMESLTSWEELEELERTMDCRQLLAFRQAYLSAHGGLKPKFVSRAESWANQPRLFKLRMTVSLLYLALLYTEQPVLPADLVRWVKSEKIPLHTPLEEDGDGSGRRDSVFFTTMQTVATPVVIENAFRLYLHLPLPPVPSPDPQAISHIIIDRLKLTECFKRLVDRALATVYRPLGFTSRRMDCECAAVILVMLRLLYGLDDRMELDEKPLAELTSDGGDQEESLTSVNSLPVWVDWVQHYSTTVSSNSLLDEEVSVNHLEPSKSRSYQNYFKFCRETVFTKCRSTPPPGSTSFQRFHPTFSKKISSIFASVSKAKPATGDTKPPSSAAPPSPPNTSSSSSETNSFPRLVHISHFIRGPKAPCTTYRPLPTSHKSREDLDKSQLSHTMQFLLSAICDIIDTTPSCLYTVLLAVEMAFLKGTAVKLRNLAQDFSSK